jgi:Lon protease-like protein
MKDIIIDTERNWCPYFRSEASSVSNLILNLIPTDKLTDTAFANFSTGTRNAERLTLFRNYIERKRNPNQQSHRFGIA